MSNEPTNDESLSDRPTGHQPDSEATLRPFPPGLPLPPNWWRCLRFGGVSGRYDGEMSTPNAGRFALDLRVDIDPRHSNSPVMDKISGDVYQVFRFKFFGRVFHWRVYRESWIVDSPNVTWSRCSVGITGKVRYWKGTHLKTTVSVVIPWKTFTVIGPAEVTFTSIGGATSTYNCDRKSSAFRNVNLEVDVCDSVDSVPTLPSYDTHAHSDRPSGLPRRTLNIENSYQEAGIEVSINAAERTVIDDSDPKFTTWSVAELHDAMEQHFKQYPGTWPNWHMWCLLGGEFDNSGVGGIMFDAAAAYGGSGKAPERQGCAVFRNHSWFNDLVANPSTQAEADAMRKLLYTYVHEIGHAFNFLHSWDKSRPDSLSWMNYDWRYDNRNGTDSFWNNFRMRFDDEELIHIRHGDRASVIMGGDPWASGGHLEAPPESMVEIVGAAPIELSVRSKKYFYFMEPVQVELRLRNLTDMPMELDAQLNPEFGGVKLHIRRPDGKILEYAPVFCKLATPDLKVLKPEGVGVEGEDRHSQNVFISFGSHGYYLDMPGEYLVRAVYQGLGDVLIPSNVHRIRVGQPFSREEDLIAQDYFSADTGLALYLNGSSSPFLESGMNVIQQVAEQQKDNAIGAQLSILLAQNLSRPFFRIEEDRILKEFRAVMPEDALTLTDQAVKVQNKDASCLTNLSYHELIRTRADLMVTMGESTKAKSELRTLARNLKKQGVNASVLNDISTYAKTIKK